MLLEWQKRLVDWTVELANRLNKLNEFMKSEKFFDLDRKDKDLLYEQARIMNAYLQILGMRIENAGCQEALKTKLMSGS